MKRLKQAFSVLLIAVFLCGCTAPGSNAQQKYYTATFLTLFDTVTTVKGSAESEEVFQKKAQAVHDSLEFYHQLFDIYHEYDGITNLKTVNDQAGIAPVPVEEPIIRMLRDCKYYYEISDGLVNVAMGSVLQLWHEERERGYDDPVNARLPDMERLRAAANHCSMDDVIIDEEASTVFLRDPQMRLDVGAVAKGWAAQQAASSLEEGLLISVGGNVCATGPKDDRGNPWVIGIQDPDSDGYLHTLYLKKGSVVTSGDYQRTYTVEGKAYHHIIDPATLYPGTLWRAVSVVCEDSALADALSTALFLLPLEEGLGLLESCGGEAVWLDGAGNKFYSPGFSELIRT